MVGTIEEREIKVLVVGTGSIGRELLLQALREHGSIAVTHLEETDTFRGHDFDAVFIDEVVGVNTFCLDTDESDEQKQAILKLIKKSPLVDYQFSIADLGEPRSRGKGRKNKPWEHHFGRN